MGDSEERYDEDTTFKVQSLYLIAIVLWIILIYILDLYKTDFIGLLILSIPIILFLISYYYFPNCDKGIGNDFYQSDIVTFGVVIISVFLSSRYEHYSGYFSKLIFIGIFLMGLSMIDVCTSNSNRVIITHIKNILQTGATAIFIYLFYTLYFISTCGTSEIKNPFDDLKV